MGGGYVLPAIAMDVQAAFTNTVPIDAYRGAGKPEANYLLERLIDLAPTSPANAILPCRAAFHDDQPKTSTTPVIAVGPPRAVPRVLDAAGVQAIALDMERSLHQTYRSARAALSGLAAPGQPSGNTDTR